MVEVPPCPCCGQKCHHSWEPENCPVVNPSPRYNRNALLHRLKESYDEQTPHTRIVIDRWQKGKRP